MKKSVILDIFNGDRGQRETMHMPKDSKKNIGLSFDAYDELKQKLSPELLKLHEKFIALLEDNFCDEVDFYFVEGFKLGLLIGIESMD